MITTLKRTGLFSLALFAVLASCSPKVESPDPKQPDNNNNNGGGGGSVDATAILTAHAWIAYDYTGTMAGIPDVTWADLPECEKDDIMNFAASKQYEHNEGATKCDPDDPQVVSSGPWSINSAATILTLDGEEVKVLKIESGNLILEFQTDIFGIILTEKFSYKKL